MIKKQNQDSVKDTTQELIKDNYILKKPYRHFKRDESPFDPSTYRTKEVVKNTILHTPVFKMITELDKSDKKKYPSLYFNLSDNKLDKYANENFQSNIKNNLKIRELKKEMMHDPTNNFTGCAIKFEFPGLDIDVATVEDED